MNKPLTLDIVVKALRNAKIEDSEIEVRKNALNLLDILGYGGSTPDNRLAPSDRVLVYRLEEAGLLNSYEDNVTFNPVESKTPSKQIPWRIFYWEINRNKLYALANTNCVKEDEVEFVYKDLNDDIWTNHNNSTI